MNLESQVVSLGLAKKLCPKCGIENSGTDFYKRSKPRWPSEGFHSYCKSCISVRTKSYYRENVEKYRLKERTRKKSLGESLLSMKRKNRRDVRLAVINGYGGKCACCDESQYEFLAIDHVNNDGFIQRKTIDSYSLLLLIRRNNFPKEYQVLCHNCNMAKAFHGACPHGIRKTSIVA